MHRPWSYPPDTGKRFESLIERQRRPEEMDQFVWFCERCKQRLFETTIRFDDPGDAVKKVYEAMKADVKNRTVHPGLGCADEPATIKTGVRDHH